MPATINMSQFCFNRSTGMRLVLYRCAAMRTEPCTRNEGTTARTAESRSFQRHGRLLQLGLSLLSDEILRNRLLRRSGDSAIRGCRIPLRVFAHANDNEAANARRKENHHNSNNEN